MVTPTEETSSSTQQMKQQLNDHLKDSHRLSAISIADSSCSNVTGTSGFYSNPSLTPLVRDLSLNNDLHRGSKLAAPVFDGNSNSRRISNETY